MELWFSEQQTPSLQISFRTTKTLYSEQTLYQKIEILETEQYGRMLVLDGMVMTTEKDEFAYHELLAHVAMHTHSQPEQVLVIGGGDGGVIREVVRHPQVKRAVLAEIDGGVVEAAKRFFPQIASGFQDPRVDVHIGDGIDYVRNHLNEFDVVLVDSTEPIGMGARLFEQAFYDQVYQALKPDGMMVAQTESPWVNQDLIRDVHERISSIFPITRVYYGHVPTYPSGLWTFTMGTKKYDPLQVPEDQITAFSETRYYNPSLHHSLFQLPTFIQQILQKEDEY